MNYDLFSENQLMGLTIVIGSLVCFGALLIDSRAKE